MRWDRLFEDLEAQLAAGETADRAAQVSELARIERARITLVDRLTAWLDQEIVTQVAGAGQLSGRLRDVADEWLLLGERAPILVALAAVSSVAGLGRTASPPRGAAVARRISLRTVLRELSRDRSPVQVVLRDDPAGLPRSGTIDAVGADHFDLAIHPLDEPRRHGAVRSVHSVPLWALATVKPSPGSSRNDQA